MSVLVRIPTVLQRYTANQAEIGIEGAETLRDLVNKLAEHNEQIKTMLLDEKGELRHRIANVFVNEEDVRFLQKLDTPLKDGDEVSIISAAAGG